MDDLTIAESINLKEALIPNPDRPFPDPFHARLGQKLNSDASLVYNQIFQVQNYAQENEMKINFSKTKFMLFNPTKIYDFIPQCQIEGFDIETVEQMKLLGITIRNDLNWESNTDEMTVKANGRL